MIDLPLQKYEQGKLGKQQYYLNGIVSLLENVQEQEKDEWSKNSLTECRPEKPLL